MNLHFELGEPSPKRFRTAPVPYSFDHLAATKQCRRRRGPAPLPPGKEHCSTGSVSPARPRTPFACGFQDRKRIWCRSLNQHSNTATHVNEINSCCCILPL